MTTTHRKVKPELYAIIEIMAQEQLEFLTDRYKMTPQEIIHLYTGETLESATYESALHAIIAHRTTAELGSSF